MATKVKAIPDGYYTITPYLSVRGAAAAIDFYKQAFGAQELYRFPMPDGRIGHAELQIGSSRIMLADEMPEMPEAIAKSPTSLGGTTNGYNLYVEDADAQFQRAVDAGAKVRRPLANQFYGDRSGTVEDPFGHLWTIATHVEDVPEEELQRRMVTAKSAISAPPRFWELAKRVPLRGRAHRSLDLLAPARLARIEARG